MKNPHVTHRKEPIEVHSNPVEHTISLKDIDGKLLSFTAWRKTASQNAQMVMTIYNNPEQDAPSASIKIPPEQMAEVFQELSKEQFWDALGLVVPCD